MIGLGESLIGLIKLGDIVLYLTPTTLTLFLIAVGFTVVMALSRPETQVELVFGMDGYKKSEIPMGEIKFRRYMAIVCGVATAGTMITGDIFDFALFVTLAGIADVGIVAATKKPQVLDAAYQYGMTLMIAGLPLFGAAALILGTTGTLSLHELDTIRVSGVVAVLFILGVLGEIGVAPFYAAKARLFRALGAPYIIMIHVSTLLIIVRTVEIIVTLL